MYDVVLQLTLIIIIFIIGTVMLDPYPFGGGVTSLEALSFCTPVSKFYFFFHIYKYYAFYYTYIY
jgi:hypothetical protein